jgi:hypothetical protein
VAAAAAQQNLVRLMANASNTKHDPLFLASHYDLLAWYQLHAKDFAGALTSTDAGSRVAPDYLALLTTKAHSLLLLDRAAEADKLYSSFLGKRLKDGKLWTDVILQELDSLEKGGITHSQFDRIRAMMRK